MTPAVVFSTHAWSASRVSPKLNSPPPSRASQPPPGGRVKGTWRSEVLSIRGGYFPLPPLPSERLRRGDAELRRRLDDVDAGGAHRLHLLGRRALAAGDDGAGVTHAAAGRRRAAGDEADDRAVEVGLHPGGGFL